MNSTTLDAAALTHAFPDNIPHLSGPGAAIRQVLAAHFVRDCPHIVEIGGHLRPVTDYLTHAPLSVLSVDPKTPPLEAEELHGRPCKVRHVSRKFQEVEYDYAPMSYGLVLLGYSLKAFGSREPLGQLLFGLIDNARTVILEYPPALERASSQVPSILARPSLEGAVQPRHHHRRFRDRRLALCAPALPCAQLNANGVLTDGSRTRPLYLEAHLGQPVVDPARRRRFDGAVFHVVRSAEADRQRADPGSRIRTAGRNPDLPGHRIRPAVHRPRDAVSGHPARAHQHAVCAERRVPGAGHHQRPVQILHQHLQGPARRKNAEAHPLRADRPHPALPAERLQTDEGRRSREHGEGRGRAARRLHRRRLRAAGAARRTGGDGADLHRRPEFLAGRHRRRDRRRAGRRDPAHAPAADPARPRAPDHRARARRAASARSSTAFPRSTPTTPRTTSAPMSRHVSAASSRSATTSISGNSWSSSSTISSPR